MTTDLAAPPIVGVAMMDATEARAHLEMMRTEIALADQAIVNFRTRAYEFAEREGWRALGYSGSAEAINAELGTAYSKSYLSRLLKAVEIERVLELPSGQPEIPERVLRPLGKLSDPAQQREAWQRATVNGTPTSAQVQAAVEEIAPPALPPLPADLARTWTRWQNDDGAIGMSHASGCKLTGRDAAALETEARQLARPLAELADHGWRVGYDPMAEGHADLHAYTAIHQEYAPISARSLTDLALAAWRARHFEDDWPDMPDEVIDGLWKAGWDWSGTAWSRGFERVDETTPEGELRYLAGLDAPAKTPAPTAPRMLPPDYADAQKRARAIGLWLDYKADGHVALYRLSDNSIYGGAADWAAALDLLERKELAGDVKPSNRADWWNIGLEMKAIQKAIDTSDRPAAVQAAQALLNGLLSKQPLPARPRPPRSADVSAHTAYTAALEQYIAAIERRYGVGI